MPGWKGRGSAGKSSNKDWWPASVQQTDHSQPAATPVSGLPTAALGYPPNPGGLGQHTVSVQSIHTFTPVPAPTLLPPFPGAGMHP